jgi:hypothetical protein
MCVAHIDPSHPTSLPVRPGKEYEMRFTIKRGSNAQILVDDLVTRVVVVQTPKDTDVAYVTVETTRTYARFSTLRNYVIASFMNDVPTIIAAGVDAEHKDPCADCDNVWCMGCDFKP